MPGLSGTISAGAYVIRNKQTSTVLHIEHARLGSDVLAFKQDESQYKDQQIWWIEPLAHFSSEDTEPEKGIVYSITNPASGKSLDSSPADCMTRTHVFTWLLCKALTKYSFSEGLRLGTPRPSVAKVEIAGVIDGVDGDISYNIISFYDDKVVDIINKTPDSGVKVHVQKLSPECRNHCWEFVVPVLAFPPGWFHIQNVGTGDLVRHNYVYNSPMLLSPPDPLKQSQYRDHWEFQWTLAHSKCFGLPTAGERNSWCIINRLTRARLSPLFGKIKENDFPGRFENLTWKLELTPSGNWTITNLNTSCLLQQTTLPHNDGTAVSCSVRKFDQKGGSQSWILRPPLLYTADESQLPPTYED